MPETSVQVPFDSIPDRGAIRCQLGTREVAVFRIGQEAFAIDAQCPHRRGPLDGNPLEEDSLAVCPWHGWRFDVRTGRSPDQPARVQCYPVRVDAGVVTVSLPLS